MGWGGGISLLGGPGPLLGPPLRVNQTMPANTLWVWLRGDVTPWQLAVRKWVHSPHTAETQRFRHGFRLLLVSSPAGHRDCSPTASPSPAMDEQAGPGVFFNNNNNSVLPGGGKGPLPDGDAGEAARAQYSIPGILHFLQHEWARFEVERAQWEVERAELQVNKP